MNKEQAKSVAALLCRVVDYHHAVQYNDPDTAKQAEANVAEVSDDL